MKTWILLSVTALVVAYLVLGRDSTEHSTSDRSEVGTPSSSEDPPKRYADDPHKRHQLGKKIPSLPIRSTTVVIDTSPRRPGEMYITYKKRIQIAQDFRDFVRESGVTDGQANALLLAMYDFQQNSTALRDSRVANSDVPVGEWQYLVKENTETFLRNIEVILSESQQRIWWEICTSCYIRLGEGVLRLKGDPPIDADD